MADDDLVSTGYDAVYRTVPQSEVFTRLWHPLACGDDEWPAEYAHLSFLTGAELDQLVANVDSGGSLVDVACGAGGPGLAVSSRRAGPLVGVDFSRVGVGVARRRAAALGQQAAFVVGSFSAVPLASGSAAAAMSVDALQYAPNKSAAFAEAVRVLRPAGRFAFTAFELDPDRARQLPVIGLDPVPDYRPLLEQAGFTVERYEQTDRWHERLTAAYQGVLDAHERLQDELGVEALVALGMEMTLTLDAQPYVGRVLAVARRNG